MLGAVADVLVEGQSRPAARSIDMRRARCAVDLAVRWARKALPALRAGQPFGVQLAIDPFDAVRLSTVIGRRRVLVAQTLCVGVAKVRLAQRLEVAQVVGELLGSDPHLVRAEDDSSGVIQGLAAEPWRRTLRWEVRDGVLAIAFVKVPTKRSKLIVSADPLFNVTWFRRNTDG